MNSDELQSELSKLYAYYNDEVKLLLANVEAMYEMLPEQVFNEIRSYNDHIARCYNPISTDDIIHKDLQKAKSHLLRIVLDCYKCINVFYHEEYVKKFQSRHHWVNLNMVDNGGFIVKYHSLRIEARDLVKKAKSEESYNKDSALSNFQLAFNKYAELEELVENSRRGIASAKYNSLGHHTLKVFEYAVAGLIAYLVVP
jgi:hypothetical protein